MLGLVLGHRDEHAGRVPLEAVAELGGEHPVALVGLHLDENCEVEGVHQVERGEIETGGHGESLGWEAGRGAFEWTGA
jgi:hypothetical protein